MIIDIVLTIVYTQIVLIPILGAIYLANKKERKRLSVLKSTNSTGFRDLIKTVYSRNHTLVTHAPTIHASKIQSLGIKGRAILSKYKGKHIRYYTSKRIADR